MAWSNYGSYTHHVVFAMLPSLVAGGSLLGVCARQFLSITANEAIATSQQKNRRLPTASSGASGHKRDRLVFITAAEASIPVISILIRVANPRIVADLIDLSAAGLITNFPPRRLVMVASRQIHEIISFGNC